MADFTCTDINGLGVTQFVFNEDGSVSGIILSGSTGDGVDPYEGGNKSTYPSNTPYVGTEGTTLSPISETCCSALNFIWESSTSTCFWTQTCDQAPDLKITLGAQGNEGAFFQVDDNETCQLEVEFDYLFQFDCGTLQECVIGHITDSTAILDIEVEISQINLEVASVVNNISILNDQIEAVQSNCSNNNESLSLGIQNQETECANIDALVMQYAGLHDTAPTEELAATYLTELKLYTEQSVYCQTILTNLNEQFNTYVNDCENQISNLLTQIDSYNQLLITLNIQVAKLEETLAALQLIEDELFTNGSPDCLSTFENLDVCVTLDKVVERDVNGQISYVDINTIETIYEEQLFKIDNIVEHFRNNSKTGIYVTGDTTCMNNLEQCIITNLSSDCGVYSASTLNSSWLHHKFEINDLETLSGLTNQKIKLGFLIKDCLCDFSILIDRIKINKVCTEVTSDNVYITKCPSFELERVCDNKKSWVATEENQDRDYTLNMRATDYDINHHKLAINTKEVDLDISTANAIETDVWCYLKDNETMLNCSTGTTSDTSATTVCNICLTGYCGDIGLNIDNLLTTELSAITTIKEFDKVLCSELIDVKSRKTISAYPTIRALYERYKGNYQGLPQSSAFDYFKMDNFVTLVGDYWVDLIEQVIPSTTIWGSTRKYRNTVFDKDKFKYKKYTLSTCNVNNISYPSPTTGNKITGIEAQITDLGVPEYIGPDCLAPTGDTQVCDAIYIRQIDHGSEFVGSVTILGDQTEGTTGDTIVVNECDLVISNINLSTTKNDKYVVSTVVGGTGPYAYEWTMPTTTGQFADWGFENGITNASIVNLTGTTIAANITANDKICVTLNVTDINGCTYGLSQCTR